MKGYQDNLLKGLIIDNFAGGGGASVGIELATGRPVDIAINHDEDAIAMHKVNHPYTTHYQEDVFVIEPERVTGGRHVDIAWFSPDCKHFSRAKGGKPVEKKIRGLSWVILKWAMSSVAPTCIFMENVEEIQTWGPLLEIDGQLHPDPLRIGETFNGFIAMLTKGIDKVHHAFLEACDFLNLDFDGEMADKLANGLGYKVDCRILKACDYGAPTIRKRFYLVARNDGKPIVFPKPTHGNGKGLKPYRTAAECIDWNIPCPSIFGRKKDLATNTQRRIARGLDKFVIKNPKPYIMSNNTNNVCHSVKEPIPTVTGIDHNALVSVHLMSRHGDGSDGRGSEIDKPTPTVTATNHEHVIAANIVHYYGGADHASKADYPLPTVTTLPRHYLAESHLCILRNNMDCKALDEPMSTITTSAGHMAQIMTYIERINSIQDLGHWAEIRKLLNDYAGYSIADDEVLIIEINGIQHFISDIGMRMLKAKELKLAQGFPEDYIIDIEPYVNKKYSEAKQIARLGNAVCPPVATALIRVNCPQWAYRSSLTTVKELEQAMCI